MKALLIALVLLVSAAPGWAGTSITSIFAPGCGLPQANANQTWSGAANTLRCVDFVPCTGITDIAQFFARTGTTTVTGGPLTIGIALYNADGTTELVEDTTTMTTTNEALTFSSPSNSTTDLDAGTMYRLCSCVSVSTGSMQSVASTTTVLEPFLNAFSVVHLGTADGSHLCTSGDPPPTTGALTSLQFDPMWVEFGTATP